MTMTGSSNDTASLLFFGDGNGSVDEITKHGTLTCKFVLMEYRESRVLTTGSIADFPYHAGLVNRFCEIHGIAFAWVHRPDKVQIQQSDCRVIGGGYLQIDPEQKALRLYGQSTAYGPFDFRSVVALLSEHEFLAKYRIVRE